MEVRAKNAQTKFREPYKKMMERMTSATRASRLNGIKVFFNVTEPTKYDDLSLEQRQKIENGTDEEILSLCKELCTEAINRDFVSYVSTGNEGSVGRNVYNALL